MFTKEDLFAFSLSMLPQRQVVAVRHALSSDDPLVKQALDRLLVTTELVHGEEIAAEIAEEARKKAEADAAMKSMLQRSMRANAMTQQAMQQMNARPKPKRIAWWRCW